MAHGIEIVNGVASFAENGRKERAWHRLGDKSQIFDRPMFVGEALKACHADYTVGLQPLAALTPDILKAIENGEKIDADVLLSQILPNARATMRMDKQTALGIVSDAYGIVQNEDAFKFVDMFCSGQFADRDNTPTIETCGVLGNGERVFVTARFPKPIELSRGDEIETYVVFTTSHDGTGAVNCLVTPIRVVCNNTLNLAFGNNSGRLSFRHTSRVMDRLDLLNKENAEFAYKALNLVNVYENEMKARFEHLRNVKISEKDLSNILAEITLQDKALKVFKENGGCIYDKDIASRGRNIYIGLKDAVESGIGQERLESGTALWALNGITTYYQNNANFKNEEEKFKSIMDGTVKRKLQRAYDLAMAV